jgi:hypothetical protein
MHPCHFIHTHTHTHTHTTYAAVIPETPRTHSGFRVLMPLGEGMYGALIYIYLCVCVFK